MSYDNKVCWCIKNDIPIIVRRMVYSKGGHSMRNNVNLLIKLVSLNMNNEDGPAPGSTWTFFLGWPPSKSPIFANLSNQNSIFSLKHSSIHKILREGWWLRWHVFVYNLYQCIGGESWQVNRRTAGEVDLLMTHHFLTKIYFSVSTLTPFLQKIILVV